MLRYMQTRTEISWVTLKIDIVLLVELLCVMSVQWRSVSPCLWLQWLDTRPPVASGYTFQNSSLKVNKKKKY